jgi:hypothetical protein
MPFLLFRRSWKRKRFVLISSPKEEKADGRLLDLLPMSTRVLGLSFLCLLENSPCRFMDSSRL